MLLGGGLRSPSAFLVYLYYVGHLCHLLEKDLSQFFFFFFFFALLRIFFVSESITSLNLSNLQYGVSGK